MKKSNELYSIGVKVRQNDLPLLIGALLILVLAAGCGPPAGTTQAPLSK